jgi:hypothetical protein
MDLLGLAIGGGAMVVVVFAVGVLIEVLIHRRWGLSSSSPREDPKLQAHQQAVRDQLGGFGSSGGPQQ